MTAGWREAATALVVLPNGYEDAGFARRMRRRLLDQLRDDVDAILAAVPSAARIGRWADLLSAPENAELVEFVAYRPGDLLGWLAPELPEKRQWSTLVEICEACFGLAARGAGGTGSASGFPYSDRVMAGHLARTRWALLSLPFTGAAPPLDKDLTRVNDDAGRLIALTQQARDDWLSVLTAIDDYPLLAGQIGDAEADIGYMASVQVSTAALAGGSPAGAVRDAEADPPGREVTRLAVTRLLLPRFAWCEVTGIYGRMASRRSLAASIVALAAALASVTLFGLASVPHWSVAYTAAACTAAGAYLMVAVGIAADASTAWPWLLRQPASAAVGVLALAAFGPDWWHTVGVRGATARALMAAGILAGISIVYLHIEAAGHGLRGLRLVRRSFLIGFFGLVQSLLVSLIGLRFLLPVFAAVPQGGPALSCWYASQSCAGQVLPAPVLVALAAAWSFASGVFLQIIWDDQPVTAPLAHVSWRRGG